MIPELGHFALIIALCLAIVQGVVPLVGAQRGVAEWMLVAVPAARAQFVFVLIAFGCLMYAFIVRDFSVLYVATNSNSALPVAYRVAAVWGAHEGALLLWALILSKLQSSGVSSVACVVSGRSSYRPIFCPKSAGRVIG